jgi:hypothetical protein
MKPQPLGAMGADQEIQNLEAKIAMLETRNATLLAALESIAAWDCLNPPDPNLCADHPWLKRLVDDAIAAVKTKEC